MTSIGDAAKTALCNQLLGRWAAEQLGLTGEDAKAYAMALAKAAMRSEGRDVVSEIRNDFDAAGVTRSEQEILRVMTEFTIQAGQQMSGGSGVSLDAAAVLLKRNLVSR
ncbi:ATPase inhibitor subunit zeta [Bosea sp. BK604]|uniref:ATPase inhibitor subunit zeta n=1 Tax=Bosea sp. BK604 TaxID=2512180 RepID=UPI00104D0F7D|nr:ATPase inhibitor subunit zeta [Bosea sp. BK604]TCR60584.1 hypothetical protein EV560_11671 [Bosea sp. BK604]